jgi:hypothetical protein
MHGQLHHGRADVIRAALALVFFCHLQFEGLALGTFIEGKDERVALSSSIDQHGHIVRRAGAAKPSNADADSVMRKEATVVDFVKLDADTPVGFSLMDKVDPAPSATAVAEPAFTWRSLLCLAGSAAIVAALCWVGILHAPGSLAALFYLCVSVAIDACIATSHSRAATPLSSGATQKSFAFNPLCNIMLVEAGKLLVSAGLFVWQHREQKQVNVVASIIRASTPQDFYFMGLPALCYTLNNILVYLAIGYNEVASFAAFRETMVLWTALIWSLVFKVSLGWRRILPLFTIVFGLVLNQVEPLRHATFSWAILLVFSMALANACGSVCNEYALKKRADVDINLQNIHLYTWCFGLAMATLAFTDYWQLMSFGDFFRGFDKMTCTIVLLQLGAGLLVSRILKYATSLQKNMVAAFRGPVLVVAGPLLALPSRSDPLTLLSAVIVGASGAYFLKQGKPVMD